MCAGKECGDDGCGDTCGECKNHWQCGELGHCYPAPEGPCLRADDCYLYVPEAHWPEGWAPVCEATCKCNASAP